MNVSMNEARVQSAVLSPAQVVVLRGLAHGKRPDQIVDDMPPQYRVSSHGIRWHIAQIYRKLNVHTAPEAVRIGTQAGLI